MILLLFCSAFFGISPVFAANPHAANIYVPPVEGGRESDRSFFFRQVTYEVALNHLSLVRDRQGSDFLIRGTIDSVAEIKLRSSLNERSISGAKKIIEDFNRNSHIEGEYVLVLDLVNSVTEEPIASQYLVYLSTEDESIVEMVHQIVYNLLAGLPKISEDNSWRENWLFVGLNALWVPRIYEAQNSEINWATYGLSIYLELHFLDFFSLSLEPQFVRDWVVVSLDTGEQYTDLLFEIPITVKFVGKWFKSLTLEPYAGIAFNISTMGTTGPSPVSWLAGLQFGIKAGSGMLVIDPRFAMDFTKSHLPLNENKIEYSRYMFQLALGYKLGFVPK